MLCDVHVKHSDVMPRQSHTDTTNRHEITEIQHTQEQPPSLTTSHSPDTKQTEHTHIRLLHLCTRGEGKCTLLIRKDLHLRGVAAVHLRHLCQTGVVAAHLLHQEPGVSPR